MARSRIRVKRHPDSLTVHYRPPRRWWTPGLWLACLAGGGALGLGLGLVAVLVGMAAGQTRPLVAFRLGVGAGFPAGTLLFYLSYGLPVLLPRPLRFVFDTFAARLTVPGALPDDVALTEIAAFHLDPLGRRACQLSLATTEGRKLPLRRIPRACESRRAELGRLTALLNAQLEAASRSVPGPPRLDDPVIDPPAPNATRIR